MESDWAAEHLQVIRTLMERSAVYRRALAPITIYSGALGLVAAVVGWSLNVHRPAYFVAYWFGVGVLAVGGSLLMVRRQAFQQAEPFWSPPTRRVAQAMMPALTAGFAAGALVFVADTVLGTPGDGGDYPPNRLVLTCLPLAWMVLYGCAVHAAGFFMRRGIRLFGWGFVLGACAMFLVLMGTTTISPVALGYGTMGIFFGCFHLVYGVYLYFTEKRGDAL